MKLSFNAIVIALALNIQSANAFAPTRSIPQLHKQYSTNEVYNLYALPKDEGQSSEAKQSSSLVTAAMSAFAGLALAAQAASAVPIIQSPVDQSTFSPPTTVVALGAYIPEESYGKMDLSMPSYTIKDEQGAILNDKEIKKQKSADASSAFESRFNFPEPENSDERKAQAKARAALKREMETEKIKAAKAAKAAAGGGSTKAAKDDGGEKLSNKEKKEIAMQRAQDKRDADMKAQIEKRDAARAAKEAKAE